MEGSNLSEEASNGWKRRQVGEKIEKRKGEGVSFWRAAGWLSTG
jgi:hypothetical protein